MSRRKGQRSRAPLGSAYALPDHFSNSVGGQLRTLSDKEKHEINDGVFHLLSEIGFEQLPEFLECFVDNKKIIKKNNRYCFGIELVERCLRSFDKDISLYQQNQKDSLDLSNENVNYDEFCENIKKKSYKSGFSQFIAELFNQDMISGIFM